MVFFRIDACECVSRDSRSESSEFAIEGLMTWGMAVSGRAIVGGCGEVRSCNA